MVPADDSYTARAKKAWMAMLGCSNMRCRLSVVGLGGVDTGSRPR
jgi:hypothetical protein